MGEYKAAGKQVLYCYDEGPNKIGGLAPIHVADAADELSGDFLATAANKHNIVGHYIDDCLTTLSSDWHGERVAKHRFVATLNAAIRVANEMDKIKKSLFYGRDNNLEPAEGQRDCSDLPNQIAGGGVNAQNTIHAILGKFTEAGEMLEALREMINGHTVDAVNLREEIGDGLWYDAILLNEIGSNFPETMAVNIAKLKARFPDKFNAFQANNRDLDTERAILEQEQARAWQEHDVNVYPSRLPTDKDAIGDVEPPKPLLKPSKPASGPAAVSEAAASAARAFDNVGKAKPRPKVEPPFNPEHAKPAGERLAPMPQEKLAQENNPKKS